MRLQELDGLHEEEILAAVPCVVTQYDRVLARLCLADVALSSAIFLSSRRLNPVVRHLPLGKAPGLVE